MTTTTTPLVFTAAELAFALQVSRRTLSRLCQAGVLPEPIRLGRCVRWHGEAVRERLDVLAGYAGGNKAGTAPMTEAGGSAIVGIPRGDMLGPSESR